MKRIVSFLLCILFGAALTGCKARDEGAGMGAEGGVTALDAGRYVEQQIKLPVPEGYSEQMLLGIADGGSDIYVFAAVSLGEEEDWRCRYFRHTIAPDGTVSTEAQPWLDALAPFIGNEMHVLLAADGTPYMYMSDYDAAGNAQAHVIQGSSDGQSGASIPGDGPSAVGGMITSLGVLDDGRMAMANFYSGTLVLTDRDGIRIGELTPGGKGRISACAARGRYVALSVPDGGLVRVYDADSQTYADYDFAFPKDSMPLMAVSGDGAVFLADGTGIYHHAANGTLWEKLVDGATSTLGLPYFYIGAFLAVEDGAYPTFYVNGSDGNSILRYRYDVTAAATADKELTVFSLTTNETVQQAIVAFNRSRPDVMVTYKVAMDGETAGTAQDYIKALNTELLAGTGPDILILDGLPLDSYIEKDVLADLGGMMDETEPVMENILNALERDGVLYAVPTGFRAPLAVGPGNVEQSFSSLDALADAAEQAGDVPLLSNCAFSFETLASYLMRYYGGALYTGDEAGIAAFLANAGRVSRATGCTDELGNGWAVLKSMPQDELREFILNWSSSPQIVSCIGGKARAVLTEPLDSVIRTVESCAAADELNLSLASVGRQFIPVGLAGVNKAGAEPEAAREFVKTLLSYDAQGGNQYAAQFPVNRQAFLEMLAFENPGMSSGLLLDDGTDFTAMWPTEARRDQLGAILNTLDTPILADEALGGMLLPEITDYLSGAVSADEATARILSLMSTYLSE